MTTVLETLVAARALIADPGHWTQGAYARTRSDMTVHSYEDTAVKFCAIGALFRVTAGTDLPNGDARLALDEAAAEFGQPVGIVWVNDKLGHSEVLKCYDIAIAKESK